MELKSGASLNHARSIAFVTMAIFQIFNLFNSRSFKISILKMNLFSNIYIIASFVFGMILTIMTVHTGILRQLFHTVPLSLNDWFKIILTCLSVIVAIEIEKMIRRIKGSRY